jgi:hypothetical protein
LAHWASPRPLEWGLYLVLAVLASVPKLRLPGMTATYSMNFWFLLFGVVHFSLPETLVMGCAAGVAQMVFNTRKRPTLLQVLFHVANLTLSVAACFLIARGLLAAELARYRPAVLALVAGQYFVTNTVLVSGVLSLLEASLCRWSAGNGMCGPSLTT